MWLILEATQWLLSMIYLSVEQEHKTVPNIPTGCKFEINVLGYFNIGNVLAGFTGVWCSQRFLP